MHQPTRHRIRNYTVSLPYHHTNTYPVGDVPTIPSSKYCSSSPSTSRSFPTVTFETTWTLEARFVRTFSNNARRAGGLLRWRDPGRGRLLRRRLRWLGWRLGRRRGASRGQLVQEERRKKRNGNGEGVQREQHRRPGGLYGRFSF